MHTKRWVISSPLTPQAEEGLVRFPPILKQILFNRGLANYEDARAFMRAMPSFDTNPFQLTGMETTADRILYAIHHNEPIAVYGDYDVDGVTA
ncbi:MAG TPA: hypothetical protein VK909_12545, partial [Anaerolineales bacterium]|nr:hypothetical protein [Anaerolineales bacterium]